MLKKVIGFAMAAIMVFALAACGQSSEGNNESAEKDAAVPAVEEEADTNGDGKTLVAYLLMVRQYERNGFSHCQADRGRLV